MFRKSDFYNHNRVSKPVNQYQSDVVRADVEMEKFQSLVFAPDPITGNPISDVSYLMYGTDEGFKQYVKQRLFSPGSPGVLAPTAEEAEMFVKPNVMTRDQYLTMMHDYVVGELKKPMEQEDD